MKWFGLFLLFGFTMGAKRIHPSVTICKRSDPDLSKCFYDNFITLLPLMKNGIPDMNIAPLEPINVENVRMEFPATRSVHLEADLSNMNVWGIGDLVMKKLIMSNSSSGTFDTFMYFNIPKIKIESDYNSQGKLLLLNIDATGNFTGEFEDLDIEMNWTSERFMKKGKEHYKWTNSIAKLTIKTLKIHFNNLFGDNTELTENTNKVINENIDELYNEVSPVVKETVTTVTRNTVNNVYSLFPIDVLFV